MRVIPTELPIKRKIDVKPHEEKKKNGHESRRHFVRTLRKLYVFTIRDIHVYFIWRKNHFSRHVLYFVENDQSQ